jgi:hypothetical protein
VEPEESSPDGKKRWGENSVFVVIPTQEPSYPVDFETLGRAQRLAAMEASWMDLDGQIRGRIPDLSVEFLSGASTWIVRSETPMPIMTLRQRLAGLPVSVADETRLSTL